MTEQELTVLTDLKAARDAAQEQVDGVAAQRTAYATALSEGRSYSPNFANHLPEACEAYFDAENAYYAQVLEEAEAAYATALAAYVTTEDTEEQGGEE